MTPEPLPPPVVAVLLQSAAATIHAELAALPVSVLEFHPVNAEWCVKEVLGRKDCARDWPALYHEFLQLRSASVAQVAALSPADLARGGHHPKAKVGFLTVADLLHEWVHHDRNHLRQMLANAQAYAWPHMDNAQRFSLPSPS